MIFIHIRLILTSFLSIQGNTRLVIIMHVLACLPMCPIAFLMNIYPRTVSRKTTMSRTMISETSTFDVLETETMSLEHSYTAAYALIRAYALSSNGVLSLFRLNENVAAEILTVMSHLTLDLANFLSPDTVSLRLLLFLGRFFSIASDYIPDHKMYTEEELFQLGMLTYSTHQLIMSALLRALLLHQKVRKRRSSMDLSMTKCIFESLLWCGF